MVEQRRALVTAKSNEDLLFRYGALIRFLRAASAKDLQRIFPDYTQSGKATIAEEPELSEQEIAGLSRDEIERIIDDASTPRRQLERVAIHRFHVPRGSMRQFSNREMLVSKIATLLRNEQAHSAIEAVARGQGELAGLGSRPLDKTRNSGTR